MEKETRQYFKAKTYKHDGGYCTFLLLIVWYPNGLFALMWIFCLIHRFTHIKGNCAEYVSGCPPSVELSSLHFPMKNSPCGLSHCLNSFVKLDDQWVNIYFILFSWYNIINKEETENYKINIGLLETHTYTECKCLVQSIGSICSSQLEKMSWVNIFVPHWELKGKQNT